ncbi:MAG: hypothetical protein R2748_30590 [Bryobacterales bacterium]
MASYDGVLSTAATGVAGISGRGASTPVLLGPMHLVTALKYVDLNPVRAGLVGRPAQYPWSSAVAHVADAAADPLVDDRA